jgi:integrase
VRGSLRRRGKTAWQLRVYCGIDPLTGKKIYQSRTETGSKRDAEKILNDWVAKLEKGIAVEPSKITLAEYLRYWLNHYAAANVGPKTLERYTEILERHVIPALGTAQLQKLRPTAVQAYYTQAEQSGRLDGGGGLSRRTILQFHRILHKALRQALRWQFVEFNVMDAVEPPKPVYEEAATLNRDELARFLNRAQGTRAFAPTLLAIYTGMRRGELLGLRWADVDLENGFVQIRQALGEAEGKLYFKAPKTQKSRRSIPIPLKVVHILAGHKKHQEKHRELFGSAYNDHDLVFACPDGSPWRPGNFTRAFKEIAQSVGLDWASPHKLRHTHASYLLQTGVHPKVASERLGHSGVSITMDLYTHLLPGMQEDATQKIEEYLDASLAGLSEVTKRR